MTVYEVRVTSVETYSKVVSLSCQRNAPSYSCFVVCSCSFVLFGVADRRDLCICRVFNEEAITSKLTHALPFKFTADAFSSVAHRQAQRQGGDPTSFARDYYRPAYSNYSKSRIAKRTVK